MSCGCVVVKMVVRGVYVRCAIREAERDRAQLERQRPLRPAWNKPNLGKLEAPLPRSVLNDPETSEEQQGRCDEGDADENVSDHGGSE